MDGILVGDSTKLVVEYGEGGPGKEQQRTCHERELIRIVDPHSM
eukprot:gene26849-biopygen17436